MKRRLSILVILTISLVCFSWCCNSGVGQGSGGSRFRSCEAIGFSSQSINDIYNSALTDRANGYDYYGERQAVANSCVNSCYYEAVCVNGCTSCAYDIIDAAYSKSVTLSTKSLDDRDPTLGVTIENLISSN